MGKRKQAIKVYGKTAHYWPVEMQPFWVVAAYITTEQTLALLAS